MGAATTWLEQMDTHVGYIPVWIKKLEGRIIVIGVYDKQSYRLVGEGKERAKRAIENGIKDIWHYHYGRIWVKETDLFLI
jgi:hypothetical protein